MADRRVIRGALPDAHWGVANKGLPDWRTAPGDDVDPDDTLLAKTPDDVIAGLGFDPLAEEDDDGEEVDEDELAQAADEVRELLGLDEANWKEGDHPRDPDGKFTSGGGGSHPVLSNIPEPNQWQQKPGATIKSFVTGGIEKGATPQQIANAIKAYVSLHSHHAVKSHGNAVLGHIEKAFNLKKGELGKAVSKGEAKPTPAKQEPAPSPKPSPYDVSVEKELGDIHIADMTSAEKIDALQELLPLATDPELSQQIKNAIAGYKEDTEEPQPTPAAKGPEPHAGSPAQAQIHKIATDPNLSNAQKIAQIKDFEFLKAWPTGHAAEFASSWVAALGGGTWKPEAAAPSPSPPPAPSAVTTQTGNMPRLARGTSLRQQAADEPDASTENAKKICPTLKTSWWSGVNSDARMAVSSYKGGSGSINGALRDQHEGGKHTQEQIDHIDELFEKEAALLTQDVVLRRGEDMPADQIEKWKAALQAGKTVRPQRTGFTSTSMASKAAFSGKNTIYEIVARKGTRALGIYAADKSFKSENEVLLRHGSVLEVYEIAKQGAQHIVRCYTF